MVDSTLEAPEPTAAVAETELPTAEAPGAPDLGSTPAPGDEPTVAAQAPTESTRPRDEKGRFIKADGTPASDAEQAVLEAAEPKSPLSPTAPPPVAPAASTSPVGEPFVFRADGQKIPITGSSVSADGTLTIPAAQVPIVRQLLAEGVSHRGSWRQKEQDYQRQVHEATATSTAKAAKYNDAAVMLWDTITNPDWLQRAANDPRELEFLRDRLDIALQRSDLKVPAPREAPPQDESASEAQLQSAAQSALEEEVEALLDGPQARAIYVTAEDREKAVARFQRRLSAYFVEQDNGIALDRQILKEDFDEELALRQASRTAALEATKAAAFNAKRNAPVVAPPPVVSPKGPGGNAAGASRVYKTREEYNKAMGLS